MALVEATVVWYARFLQSNMLCSPTDRLTAAAFYLVIYSLQAPLFLLLEK